MVTSNNINKWTNKDSTFFDKIIKNYYFPSNKVFKIYVQETSGDGFNSKVFLKNMSIYNSGSKVGNVLGITKMNTTVDKVYNETQIKNIETIKNNDYY